MNMAALSEKKKFWISLALLLVTAFIVYANSFSVPFLMDDKLHIEDPRVQRLWPPWRVILKTSRPVTDLSLAINYSLAKKNVWQYHLTNMMIHITTAFALLLLIQRTLTSPRLSRSYAGKAWPLSLSIALIWMVHPLLTQGVTYIIQRAECLMALFYLWTIYCVNRSVTASDISAKKSWEMAAVASCLLGTGSKQVMVTAPVMALIYDRVFLAGSFKEIFRGRAWLYARLCLSWILLILLISADRRFTNENINFVEAGVTPLDYAFTQFGVIAHYLKLAIWPSSLCFDYGWPIARDISSILPYFIVVSVSVLATIRILIYQPSLGFLGIWIFLILAPTSSVYPIGDAAFEHRMYLSLAGVVTVLVLAGDFLLGKAGLPQKHLRRVKAVAVAVTIIVFGGLAINRNGVYQSRLSLWKDVVSKRPGNARAHNSLANAYFDLKYLEKAKEHYFKTLALRPDVAEAYNNIGFILLEEGRVAESIPYFNKSLELKPLDSLAHNNLARAYLQLENFELAMGQYQTALSKQPFLGVTHNNIRKAYIENKRWEEGVAFYENILKNNETSVAAHFNIGVIYSDMAQRPGQTEQEVKLLLNKASDHLWQALQLDPRHALAHYHMGNIFIQQGRIVESMDYYETSNRLDPDNVDNLNNLGSGYMRLGRLVKAKKTFARAIELDPGYILARINLGITLIEERNFSEAKKHFQDTLKIDPDSDMAHFKLGQIALIEGRALEAIKYLQVSVDAQPENPIFRFYLGNALSLSGQWVQAKEHLNETLRLDPDFQLARQLLNEIETKVPGR